MFKHIIFLFIIVQGINSGSLCLNTDQISSVGRTPGLMNICGNNTLIRFYNGDSACVLESATQVYQLIKDAK